MNKFLQKIYSSIVNLFPSRKMKIGETPLLNVYKKVTKDGTEIFTTIDKATGEVVKIVEKFPELAGSVTNNGLKFFQSMNRKFKITDFRKGKVVDMMSSKVSTNPIPQLVEGKVLNVFSPTTEVARIQKRVFDLNGNWQKDVEYSVNKPGCREFATKHEVFPNNYAFCTFYEKGKAPERIRSSITNICSSLKV